MRQSPHPNESTRLKGDRLSLRASILAVLSVSALSTSVNLLWRALGWPGLLFASTLAFFIMMGAFFAWNTPGLRARPWYTKIGVALLYGLPGGLLLGWLGTALLH